MKKRENLNTFAIVNGDDDNDSGSISRMKLFHRITMTGYVGLRMRKYIKSYERRDERWGKRICGMIDCIYTFRFNSRKIISTEAKTRFITTTTMIMTLIYIEGEKCMARKEIKWKTLGNNYDLRIM